MVSDADDVGVIDERIVRNIYENPIVVYDISARNANLMFEIGMRLAFDKPVIILKDDKTPYSFDTSSIEHLEYPRDLRFNKIEEFKLKLAINITATMDKFKSDPNAKTFLSHFGQFKVAKIDTVELSSDKFIISELNEIRRQMEIITYQQKRLVPTSYSNDIRLRFPMPDDPEISKEIIDSVKSLEGVQSVSILISEKYNYISVETTRGAVGGGIQEVIM